MRLLGMITRTGRTATTLLGILALSACAAKGTTHVGPPGPAQPLSAQDAADVHSSVTLLDSPFGQGTLFAAPDGTVCELTDDGAECYVDHADWPSDADIDCTPGKALPEVSLRAGTLRVDRGCVVGGRGDPVALPVGSGLQVGQVRCLVESHDVSCVRPTSGAGFTVSASSLVKSPSAAVVSATPSRTSADLPSGSAAWLETPSGRVACQVTATITCEVHQPAWKAPAHRGSCEFDLAPIVVLEQGKGETQTACVSDTISGGPVLGYGTTLRVGTLACTSKTTGLTCRNATSEHGFTVNRARFTGF